MEIKAIPVNPNATLSKEDNDQLIADEAVLKNDSDGYQFIWGLVSDVPLRDTHFPNADKEYSLVYLKDNFEKYILIKDLSDTFLRLDIEYKEDGTDAPLIAKGQVCKIPLDSRIEFFKTELIDEKVVLNGPFYIEELGTIDKYKELKSNTTQSIFSIRRASNL